MSRRRLSVVMPNHNHARYIGEALESILSQSVPADEVIVVDDGSADDSVAVIESFAKRAPSLTLLRHETRRGVQAATNLGLSRASGDYVMFTAADDKILPGYFEKSLRILEANPAAGLCCALCRMIGPDGEDLGVYRTPVVSSAPRYVPPAEVLSLFLDRGPWILTYSAIYRRDAVLELGGSKPELGPSMDSWLIQALSLRHGVCFLPEPLVVWRKLETGHSKELGRDEKKALDMLEFIEGSLTHPDHRRLFPPEYVAAHRRNALRLMIDDWKERSPYPYALLADVVGRMPRPGLLDRLFRRLLEARSPLAPLLTRFYVVMNLPRAERRRVFLGKLLQAPR